MVRDSGGGQPDEQRNVLAPLLLAVQFLTVFPVPLEAVRGARQQGHAVIFFPVAGLLIGLCEVAAIAVLGRWVAPGILAALVLLLGAVLTGGLHLDGLADTCDGLFAFRTTERRLEIMRDSRIGSYGVVGLVCVLLARAAALGTLLAGRPMVVLTAVLLATLLSRWAIAFALVRYPYARAEGAGSGFKQYAGRQELLLATAIAAVAAVGIGGLWGAGALMLVWLVTLGLVRWMRSLLPGLTGDTYGAISELCETVVLVAATALLPGG